MLTRRDFLLIPLLWGTVPGVEVQVRVAGGELARSFSQKAVHAWAQLFWERVFFAMQREHTDLSERVLLFQLVRRQV